MILLRTAFGPGLVTLTSEESRGVDLLRTAFGPGLVTLTRSTRGQRLTLRTAFGPGLVTLQAVDRPKYWGCGLLSDPDWLH